MEAAEYLPPSSVRCPRCGAPATHRPRARRAGEGWEADFECDNGHRPQLLSKPKRRPGGAG